MPAKIAILRRTKVYQIALKLTIIAELTGTLPGDALEYPGEVGRIFKALFCRKMTVSLC
jgi:hypothetical protein